MQTLTDAELMEAYSSRQDEGAFGELMRRHGAMVYRACHRLLKDAHEAEDASQAVFVVLARKAGGLRKGDLAAWLYRVAHLVAAETVRKRMHRAKREESYAVDEAIQTDGFAASDVADPAPLGLVDAALLSLPERYREAVILRYLQNHSEAEAARRAGCAVGTLSMRASRGIAKLRQRLAKRGVALGGVALAGLLTSEASAAVPETLLPSILASVKTAAATTATATGATSTAAMLAKGAMKAMFIAKVKMVAAIAAAVVMTGTVVPVGIAVAQAVGKDASVKTNTASIVDDAEAMYRRAGEQMRAKDYKAAIQTLDALLQTYPDAKTIRPEALFWLGFCYTKEPDPAAAKRVFEKLNAEFSESNLGTIARSFLFPDSTWGSLLPRPDYEVSLTEADYSKLDTFEATILGKADQHFAKKEPHEYDLAAAAYDFFVRKYSKSKAVPYALVRKGRSLQFVGKRSEAIKIYGGVVDHYPDLISYAAPALLYLAQCHYLNKGNVSEEATKAIAQLRADKDYGKHEAAACATFLLAYMQAVVSKTEAIATLGTIGASFPAYAALAQLRQAEEYEKAGKTAEAISAYRATMTKYPGTPESALAHSALEKMGSRSPDATHVPLVGKAAEIEKKAQEAKVTLSLKEATADNALDRLSMSGITIRKTDIPKDAKISMEMRDASVLDGVKRVTMSLGLTYVIVDDAIEVSGKK